LSESAHIRALLILTALTLVAPWGATARAAPLPQGQLDAVLAPIALYPDAILAPLLMATTYPDEMVAADQWRQKSRNARLTGAALNKALLMEPWDPSVKALVTLPVLLDELATRMFWAQKIGEAFLAGPPEVMREIQRLRRAALTTGKLKPNRYLVVQEKGDAIVILPPKGSVVYVPIYNPGVVFGAWGYPNYPPVYIQPPPGFHAIGPDMEAGIGYSRGRPEVKGLWGWAMPEWSAGTVTLDVVAYNRLNRYGTPARDATWHYAPHPAGYFRIPEPDKERGAGGQAARDRRERSRDDGRRPARRRREY
jgi:Protein of unknown function (DUF3300)